MWPYDIACTQYRLLKALPSHGPTGPVRALGGSYRRQRSDFSKPRNGPAAGGAAPGLLLDHKESQHEGLARHSAALPALVIAVVLSATATRSAEPRKRQNMRPRQRPRVQPRRQPSAPAVRPVFASARALARQLRVLVQKLPRAATAQPQWRTGHLAED